jgi:hypothetical protein
VPDEPLVQGHHRRPSTFEPAGQPGLGGERDRFLDRGEQRPTPFFAF